MKYLLTIIVSISAYSAPRGGFEPRVILHQMEYMIGVWDNFRHSEQVLSDIKKDCGENYYIVTSNNMLTDAPNKTLKETVRYDSSNKLVIYRCVKTANINQVLDLVY